MCFKVAIATVCYLSIYTNESDLAKEVVENSISRGDARIYHESFFALVRNKERKKNAQSTARAESISRSDAAEKPAK